MQTASLVLSLLVICFYLIAFILFVLNKVTKDERFLALGSTSIVIGFFCQTMDIAALTLANTEAFFSPSSILLLISWFLAFAYCMVEVITKTKDYGAYAMPIPLIVMVVSLFIS